MSSQGGRKIEDLDSESDLAMTEVWPLVPPRTREAPAAEPGAGEAGLGKATPRHYRSPPRGTISMALTAAAAIAMTTEYFNDWGGRGYDDSVPGEVTKTTASGARTT